MGALQLGLLGHRTAPGPQAAPGLALGGLCPREGLSVASGCLGGCPGGLVRAAAKGGAQSLSGRAVHDCPQTWPWTHKEDQAEAPPGQGPGADISGSSQPRAPAVSSRPCPRRTLRARGPWMLLLILSAAEGPSEALQCEGPVSHFTAPKGTGWLSVQRAAQTPPLCRCHQGPVLAAPNHVKLLRLCLVCFLCYVFVCCLLLSQSAGFGVMLTF